MDFAEMKDRIAHIIRAQNLTAAEFALRLGIQPSNISHLLSGRNNPSLDFVKKLKETFPEYSLDWIVFGRGPMTVSDHLLPFVEPSSQESRVESSVADPLEGTLFGLTEPISTEPTARTRVETSLKQVILVYKDNTFEVLSPR